MAIAVTTKIDKRSSVRNKVRRRVKEVFRTQRHRISPPQDLLIIARSGCVSCSFEDIRREIVSALTGVGLVPPSKAEA